MSFFTKFWTKPSAKLVLRVKISAHFTLPGANEKAAATKNSFVRNFTSNVIVHRTSNDSLRDLTDFAWCTIKWNPSLLFDRLL